MKYIITLLLSVAVCNVFAQQKKFDGTWEGKINAGISMRLVFEVSSDNKGNVFTVLRSPDQSPRPLATDTTYISGDSIYTSAKKFGITFSGKLLSDSSIDGSFVQGITLPLVLTKVAFVADAKRPQTPTGPFGYNSKEVTYYNADKTIEFGGTFTWPSIPAGTDYIKAPVYTTVILISGSGPQDRDETILMHRPFAVIADYLTKKGFAVLRVDDRGIGKTTGQFATATSQDFAKDVEAGLDFLKTVPDVDTTNLGLIGHSEGGMIAPMVAARRKDVKFIVLLAGPGIPVAELMYEQIEAASRSEGISPRSAQLAAKLNAISIKATIQQQDSATILAAVNKFYSTNINAYKKEFDELMLTSAGITFKQIMQQAGSYNTPWFRYFFTHNPQPYLQKLTCDVLALNGEKDVQVLPTSNLNGIRTALKKSGVKKYEVKEISGLNHLFQTCKKCSPAEYGELEETFSPAALKIIGDWMESQK